METTHPAYIRFANKYELKLINGKYLETELTDCSDTEFEDSDFEKYEYKGVYNGNFDLLDELLLKICPKILPLQYKFLYKKCVDIIQKRLIYSYILVKQCDIEKLYNFLVTNKLLSEEELHN